MVLLGFSCLYCFVILLLQYKIVINFVVAKRIALGVLYYTESKWCQIKEELTKLNIVLVTL